MNLIPCPFCGQPANPNYIENEYWSSQLIQRNGVVGGYGYAVICSNESSCGAIGPIRVVKADAIRAWNSRALIAEKAAAK